MRTDQFDYYLPPDLIAQTPVERGRSRMLVLHRDSGAIEHRNFSDLIEYLDPGDVLVLNDTRVSARRLYARRDRGEPAEILLLHPMEERRWTALVRPGKGLKPGRMLRFDNPAAPVETIIAQVIGSTSEGGRILEFASRRERDCIGNWGVIPLPPYITTPLGEHQEALYQTVYATNDGSAAAPTAGLHFTAAMLQQAAKMGVHHTFVTLHIGIDTFRPVRTEEIETHEMHGEFATVSAEAADVVNRATGRVIAVGTTTVRTLESAASRLISDELISASRIAPFSDETRLFISPGYRFHAVDALITNFHLPRSTLLMMISAFAGRDAVLNAYAEAVRRSYRFYSFGDAMLII
jgi:S-adenosylmethionine:tRNA ribosyltransferase-isomerase